MTHQQIGIVALVFAAWVPVTAFLVVALLRSREEKHKFKLYALRDDLLYLVASGKISEGDFLFRLFYGALNSSISAIHTLTVASLINASIEAKTALAKESRERLLYAIERASPEVREFTNEMFQALREIMISNSPLLVFLLKAHHKLGGLATRVKRQLLTKDACETYDTYKYFERMPRFATNGVEHTHELLYQ
jgi:hypothetical protein